MVEKNWPQATKHRVEKVEKKVTELEAKAKNLALNVRDVDNRLDTMQATASASALVEAVNDVAAAIREGGGGGEAELAALRQQMGDALDKIAVLTKANTAALEAPMAKRKSKKSRETTSEATGKEGTQTMAVSAAELKTKLDATLQAVTDARPGVDAAVALIASLRTQLADAIENSADLTEAAATVDAILAAHQANAQALADGSATPAP